MDIQRPDLARKKRNRRILFGCITAVAVVLLVVGAMRMEPPVPSVSRDAVWIGDVERGRLEVNVRGIGSLVPETVRWVTAESAGRVEAIHRLPGEAVSADAILVVLSNPTLLQELSSARSQLLSSRAALENQRAREEDHLLEMEFELARLEADLENALADVEVNQGLFDDGLIAEREIRRSRTRHRQLQAQTEIARRRLDQQGGQIERKLAPLIATIEQMEEQVVLLEGRVNGLRVRAGIPGVMQRLQVQIGQQLAAGEPIAQVANPLELKAVVRVPETQARDVQIGQTAGVDTRFGVIQGRVSRVNPTVEAGTVDVDIQFEDAELPGGVRVDLTVEGIIELASLEDVVFISRPAGARENSRMNLFRVGPDGSARRVTVQFGPASVRQIAVLEGLEPGDRVILSDMSDWQDREVVRLR